MSDCKTCVNQLFIVIIIFPFIDVQDHYCCKNCLKSEVYEKLLLNRQKGNAAVDIHIVIKEEYCNNAMQ